MGEMFSSGTAKQKKTDENACVIRCSIFHCNPFVRIRAHMSLKLLFLIISVVGIGCAQTGICDPEGNL
jgi:hypothetical protein